MTGHHRLGSKPVCRTPNPANRCVEVRYRMHMSYLLYDFLLPYIGEQAATYWAQLFVVDPI